MRKIKTLVLGAAIVDVILKIPALPKSGEDVSAKDQTIVVGGCAYNVASTLRNFDIEHSLVVPVGNGMYGDVVKSELEKNNYKIYIKDDNEDNGYCLCLVEDGGERTFITLQGIEFAFKSQWLDFINVKEYENIYISGYEMEGVSGEVISKWLIANSIKNIYFAPGPRINFIISSVMHRIFSLSPIIHLNEKEALDFTGAESALKAAEALYVYTNNAVFITLGAEGVLYFDGIRAKVIKARQANVVDTIGAGDSHIASIIAASSLGYDYEAACRIANNVSAKVVETKGPIIEKNKFNKGDYLI